MDADAAYGFVGGYGLAFGGPQPTALGASVVGSGAWGRGVLAFSPELGPHAKQQKQPSSAPPHTKYTTA